MEHNMNLEVSNIISQLDQFDYLKILQYIPAIIAYFVTKSAVYGYRLCRDFKPKKNVKIYLPPELTPKYSSIDEDKILAQKYGERVIEFANTIKDKIPNSNLINFYNNLNEIKIKQNKFRGALIKGIKIMGSYDIKANTIRIDDGYVDAIYHELFHLSSAKIEGNIYYDGFSQVNNAKYFKIGIGLTEGYTEMLTRRYFGEGRSFDPLTYKIERYIVYNLEKIIGQEKMESFYFDCNLYGLINELKKYDSEENIINFIRSIDFINTYINDSRILFGKNRLITKKLKSITTFLISCYAKKMINEFNDNLINKEEFKDKLNKYIDDIGFCRWYGNKCFEFFDEGDVNNILKRIFEENKVNESIIVVCR